MCVRFWKNSGPSLSISILPAYASQHGEMAQYNRSYQANFDCKEAIEHAISAHYADNRLDTESAVKAVLEKFGSERVQFILANTIQHKDSDGRVSRDNKAWAKTIPMPEDSGTSRHCAYLLWMRSSWSDRSVYTAGTKNASGTGERLCLAKAQTGAYHPQACFIEETGAGTMSAKKRKRDVPVLFWVSDAEMEAIQQKMAQFGTKT